jgi:sulfite exporter TauE/SafE
VEQAALLGWALWLGVMAAIHPCPMANNIAAIAYLGRDVASLPRVALRGLMYTLGRLAVYLVLGAGLAWGLVSAVGASDFLQRYSYRLLGPVMLLAGMVSTGLLRLEWLSRGIDAQALQRRLSRGLLGSALLGAAFALSFCPIPAAIFFVGLVPLAAAQQSPLLMPALFGIGSALPVLVASVVLAGLAGRIGSFYNRLAGVEKYARLATGVVFILLGIYYCLIYLFEIHLF